MWTAPTPDEKARLLGEHSHRFPLPVPISVIGDRGARLQLSFLLGNPSGSVRTANGSASPIFSTICASMLLVSHDRDEDDDELIRDCVLWPGPREISAARNRWPAITIELSRQIARKMGIVNLSDVRPRDDLPDAIVKALESHPRAVAKRLSPPGEKGKPHPLIVVLDCPDRLRFDAFSEALSDKGNGTDRPRLVRDYVEGLIVAVDGVADAAALCDRWPGAMAVLAGAANRIGGAAEDARLGEW